MAKWYTAESVKIVDKNLAQVAATVLEQLVYTARNQVLEQRPLPPRPIPGEELEVIPPGDIPGHWALGHLMQIQALAKANKVGPGDATGPDGYTVRVYPMDWTIKAVLRPPSNDVGSLVG